VSAMNLERNREDAARVRLTGIKAEGTKFHHVSIMPAITISTSDCIILHEFDDPVLRDLKAALGS